MDVCVCVKNALIFSKKSANKIYHEKICQKFLSSVVPQLSAALLRVRPLLVLLVPAIVKRFLNFVLKKVGRFSDS